MNFLLKEIKVDQNKEKVLVFTIYLLISVILHYRIWRGEIPYGHDSKFHFFWIQNFSHQVLQGDLYPRWLYESNYRYGSPTFVFYPPLIFYISTFIKVLGANFNRVLAVLFTGITFSTGVWGYLCNRGNWGTIPAIISGLFFLQMPYQYLCLYNRAALAEAAAISLIPLGIWATNRALHDSKYRLLMTITSTLLTLTHIPSLLLSSIFWILYILIIYRKSSIKETFLAIGSVVLGWGVAAFFLVPVLLEKQWVAIDSMKKVGGGYAQHLLNASKQAKFLSVIFLVLKETLSLFMVCAFTTGIIYLKNKKIKIGKDLILLTTFCLLILFLMSNFSYQIWSSVSVLQSVQFPWRLLGLFSSLAALMPGYLIFITTHFVRLFIICILSIFLVFGIHSRMVDVLRRPTIEKPNGNVESVWTAINQPLSGFSVDVPEYRPRNDKEKFAPKPGTPRVTLTQGSAKVLVWKTKLRVVEVMSVEDTLATFRVYDYPAWKLYVDDKFTPTKRSKDGTIAVNIPAGKHHLELKYEWTSAMYLGTCISLVSLGLILRIYVLPVVLRAAKLL